jgi:hypothetical protein
VLPRYLLIVFALAGDSTITILLAATLALFLWGALLGGGQWSKYS